MTKAFDLLQVFGTDFAANESLELYCKTLGPTFKQLV